MRLYLALAVLMLAFVAYTEAQDDEIQQSFARFTEQMNELGRNWAEKAKSAFDDLHRSEFATNSRNWFQEQFEKVKAKVGELTQ